MENTTKTQWEVGDKFYFIESPLPYPLSEKAMQRSYTITAHEHGEFYTAKFSGTKVTVSTRWIRKPGKDE
jgi:hypothetical protein